MRRTLASNGHSPVIERVYIGDLDDASIPSPLFRQDTAHLREAGAPELLAASAAAPPALRKAVLKLVQEIARDCRTRPVGVEEDAPRFQVARR